MSFATADEGAILCPKSCPWSAHLLLVFVLQLSIQEVQRHWLTEIDDLQKKGRAREGLRAPAAAALISNTTINS